MTASTKHDPSVPLSDYDLRRMFLAAERAEPGSVWHDAWLLHPDNADDQLPADPLRMLELSRRLREQADRLEVEGVKLARRYRFTWDELGNVFGLTRQGAFNRWARVVRDITAT